MIKIYLAHPFVSRVEIRKLEKKLQRRYKNISFVNPFYTTGTFEVFRKEDKSDDKYYQKLLPLARRIVRKDINLIAGCDYIIAFVNGEISYGTIQEMVYARVLGTKVILICSNGQHNHPWLTYHSDIRLLNDKELIPILNQIEQDAIHK